MRTERGDTVNIAPHDIPLEPAGRKRLSPFSSRSQSERETVACTGLSVLLVSEKLDALVQLQGMAITGRLGRSPLSAALLSVAHFRRAVASNHSRLSYPTRKS